jgi:hypothetical protein
MKIYQMWFSYPDASFIQTISWEPKYWIKMGLYDMYILSWQHIQSSTWSTWMWPMASRPQNQQNHICSTEQAIGCFSQDIEWATFSYVWNSLTLDLAITLWPQLILRLPVHQVWCMPSNTSRDSEHTTLSFNINRCKINMPSEISKQSIKRKGQV